MGKPFQKLNQNIYVLALFDYTNDGGIKGLSNATRSIADLASRILQ